MKEVIILFTFITVIVAFAIVVIYFLICHINRNFGLDSNGRPICNAKNNDVQNINIPPQVIKIELVQNSDGSMGQNNCFETIKTKNPISEEFRANMQMVDIVTDMKDKKVETSFESGKRIGKIS